MKISKFLLLASFSVASLFSIAQEEKFWIYPMDMISNETNKAEINPADVALSQRAIDRRVRQNIPLRITDVSRRSPVFEQRLKNLGLEVRGYSRWLNAYSVSATAEKMQEAKTVLFSYGYVTKPVMSLTTNNQVQTAPILDSRPLMPAAPATTSFYDYGLATEQTRQVHGEALHDAGFDGSTKLIAVIDASFFAANTVGGFSQVFNDGRVVATYDFVEGDTNVFRATSAHGMNVWSIMVAEQNGALVGSAPRASYALLRSEDAGSETKVEEDNWILAAEFADSIGADVINTSLSYNTFDDGNDYTMGDMDGRTAIITLGAVQAHRAGMLVVVGAGNSGASSSWPIIGAPADADSVITVGAVDSTGLVAGFSSLGPSADGRVKPDVVTMGVLTAHYATNGMPNRGNGTSYSAPVLAGFAACLWEAYPNATNYDIIEKIKMCSNAYSNPNFASGYGIPNFAMALSNTENAAPTLELKVMPNPSNGEVYVELDIDNLADFEVLDLNGRVVQTGKLANAGTLYLASNLSNGVYTLRVTTESTVHQARVVLNR